ncbi:uncharacterized protein LOC111262286, partial [Varroa jacobsoni]|uniref:uncharacterized protein LOC111262286 n=1 Tax=Varroa jacobsoni TaxID=62625 RepID=UPI000BF4EDD0
MQRLLVAAVVIATVAFADDVDLSLLALKTNPSFKWITKCVNEHSDNEKCYVLYDSLNTAERAEVIKVELKTEKINLTDEIFSRLTDLIIKSARKALHSKNTNTAETGMIDIDDNTRPTTSTAETGTIDIDGNARPTTSTAETGTIDIDGNARPTTSTAETGTIDIDGN